MARKTTTVMKKSRGKSNAEADRQLTCFVVTGFGRKTDFATGRVLDLDKTYEQLVRPAFDDVNVNAFRAIDANLTGSIDSIMYQWLYEADIVIADLSTLNANVFYELGVRHAQKPNTTIIIAEMVLMSKIPFDLSSFVIHAYEHAGDQIAEPERKRFRTHLAKLLQSIIDVEAERLATAPESERENDSPCYTFLPGMTPPRFTFEKNLTPPQYMHPGDRAPKDQIEAGESLGSIISAAEAAKNKSQHGKAIELFTKAIEIQKEKPQGIPEELQKNMPEARPDTFLAQRLALVTYKAGEKTDEDGNIIDKTAAIQALIQAENILEEYCAPNNTTDPETLGLSGAINKRRYDHTGDPEFLDQAISFYERGFYVKQDYYNGINVAFMYTMKANLETDHRQAVVFYGHGNIIRRRVAEICNELIDNQVSFKTRGDRHWVYMTLAETHRGMERPQDAERLLPKIEAMIPEGDTFSMSSYQEQQTKLDRAIAEFYQKHPIKTLGIPSTPSHSTPATPTTRGESGADAEHPVRARTAPPAKRVATESAVYDKGAIVVDADIVKGKPIKSVEINCKIEYE